MTKHSKPKRHKHYRAKPVYGIPPILLRTENAEDQVKNLERASRDALLKFHFGTADEEEFSMILKKSTIFDTLEALSYFDSNYQEVMGNLRRYVRQGLDEGDESLAEVARKGAL